MGEGRVLVVDADPAAQRLLRSHLGAHGFEVHVARNEREALRAVEPDTAPDVILLDIDLVKNGGTFCQALRARTSAPIIVVTATDTPAAKITALDSGADDCLTKPVHFGELGARIRAVRRRASANGHKDGRNIIPTLTIGELTIDLEHRAVRHRGTAVRLTRTEFNLLRVLAAHKGRTLSYEYLLKAVWGEGASDIRPVHVHVCNLRRKLEAVSPQDRYIVPVPRTGYCLRHADISEILSES